MDEDIWSALDELDFSILGAFSEGKGPPAMESDKEEEPTKIDTTGILWEITTKIYVWSDLENHKYQLNSSQTMTQLGELTLEEAQKRMARRNRRKGGT